ncbi:hypothetical protein ACOMHN_060049 [Nucella lapillus]
MAFFRGLRQNFINLHDYIKRRKRSFSASSRRDSGRDNSENNHVRNLPEPNQPPAQDIPIDQTSTNVDEDVSSKRQGPSTERHRTQEESHPQGGTTLPKERASRSIPSASSEALESDSELEDKGVPRCQCSRKNPFSPFSDFSSGGSLQHTNFAEEIYGESNTGGRGWGSSRDRSAPSTSKQIAELRTLSGGTTDTGQSSCSLDDRLMDEMVSTLKTRGSLSRRRSRSRSRRSRPRQGYENGIVVNNVRVIHTIPRRETDSDESNTSLNDMPLAFLSSTQHTSTCHSNIHSDSSFHSVAGSEACATPQASTASTKMEDGGEEEEAGARREEEEEGEDWGVNSTEHNRSLRDDAPISRQIEELSSYGPEEFVLDLLLAMCRGVCTGSVAVPGHLVSTGVCAGSIAVPGHLVSTGVCAESIAVPGHLVSTEVCAGSIAVPGHLVSTGVCAGSIAVPGHLVSTGVCAGSIAVPGSLSNIPQEFVPKMLLCPGMW